MTPIEPVRAWRLIDTEPQTPAWHAACDAALLEAKVNGLSPDALVFSTFNSPCLRLGAHQLESDAGVDACRAKSIDLRRRLTGGPAFLADPRQLSFSLVVSRRAAGDDFAERVNGALANALQKAGYPAEARAGGPELQSKKVGWLVSATEGDAILVQGHVYVHVDLNNLAQLAPSKTFVTSLHEIGAGAAPPPAEIRQMLVQVLAERFEVSIDSAELTNEERALLAEKVPAMRQDGGASAVRAPEGVTSEATVSGRGGLVRATVHHGEERNKIRQVLFSGDFCSHPRGLARDLASALENTDINQAPDIVEEFFSRTKGDVPGLSSSDFFTALSLAFMKRRVALSSAPDPAAWKKSAT